MKKIPDQRFLLKFQKGNSTDKSLLLLLFIVIFVNFPFSSEKQVHKARWTFCRICKVNVYLWSLLSHKVRYARALYTRFSEENGS
jgi:hypothetical protein